MKKFILLLTLALGLGANSLCAMGSFEGVVDYQMSTDSGNQTDMEYLIKGTKFRADFNHDKMEVSTIMDMKTHRIITLLHKQKMYMTHTMDMSMRNSAKNPMKGSFHKASGSKTILGHGCQHWVYEDEKGKTDMWLTPGMGTFAGISSDKMGSMDWEKWMKEFKGKGLFPLEIDSTAHDGKTMTMVATKLEKKHLSSGLFEVPSGYKKMPDYSQMMKNQQGSAGDDLMKNMKPKLPF